MERLVAVCLLKSSWLCFLRTHGIYVVNIGNRFLLVKSSRISNIICLPAEDLVLFAKYFTRIMFALVVTVYSQ